MSRLLVLLIVTLLVWVALARLGRRLLASPLGRALAAALGPPATRQASTQGQQITAELVRCAGCGVHVPERLIVARAENGDRFCAECRRDGSG